MSISREFWKNLASWKGTVPAEPIRHPRRVGLSWDSLEDRVVLSGLGGHGFGGHQAAAISSLNSGLGSGGCQGVGGSVGGSSSVLSQDARLVQQAFQTFNSSYQAAVSALRQTATSTAGPTTAGLDAYNTAVANAITALNSTITSDLSGLTTTGSALSATISGYTATLQSELVSAGSGLANSSNQAVRALNQEAGAYIRGAQNQATTAILNDSASGTITQATLKTYNQAVRTAYQAFGTALGNAEQSSITNGTVLDSTAVTSAVNNLRTALSSGIAGLGLPAATTSTLTATVATALDTLTSSLTGIAAPTAGNSASARLFLRSVSSAVSLAEGTINQAASTAVTSYNNSLL